MKPRFALDLTNDHATLLERAEGGWIPLGRAAFDEPDLKAELARLRALAEERAPEGFVTKLILPNAQILYFEAVAPGPDRAARRAQIIKALSGRTPYHIDDLVFDFTAGGQKAAVAVITRLTLQEAEAFAAEHGFRPAAFVAIPDAGRFAGEPFFGLSETAQTWLGAEGRYDRDQDPVRILAASPVAAPAPEAESLFDSPPPAPQVEEAPAPPRPEGDAGTSIAPEPAIAEPVAVLAPALVTTPHQEDPEAPFIEVADDDATDVRPADLALVETAPAGAKGDEPADLEPQSVPVAPAAAPSTAPQEPAPAPAAGFQSRRHVPGSESGQPSLDDAEEPGTRLADIVPRLGGMAGLATSAGIAVPKPSPASVRGPGTVAAEAVELQDAGRIARLVAGSRRAVERPTPAASGGFFAQPLRPGLALAGMDMPRLVAGVSAFLMLAAVLFWAFLSGGETAAPNTSPAPVAEAPSAPAPATAPVETAPTTEAANPAPESSAEEVPSAADLVQPTVAATPPATQAAVPATDASAPANLAGESDAPQAADASALPDAGALAGDPPLPGQALPQPFGTLLRYGPDGLIVATPEGVITPGGFTLIAGRPPRLPPARPAGLAPAPDTTAAPAPEPDAPFADPALVGKNPRSRPAGLTPPPATVTTPEDDAGLLPPVAPPVDSRHAALRPQARPAAVAAAAAARRAQDEAVAEAAASAARAEAEAAAAAMASASPQAVATSRRPKARTATAIAAAVASAQAAAAAPATVDNSAVEAALVEAQTAPEPEPAAAAAPEPEPPPAEVDEPEPLDGIATLPTTRTVAKKSTYANAIDLGEVNLIGVYGSSSNRRALVRMPNGRFVKVQVGDRLDGGKVAAIGDSELRYVKKGRTITLKIMKSG